MNDFIQCRIDSWLDADGMFIRASRTIHHFAKARVNQAIAALAVSSSVAVATMVGVSPNGTAMSGWVELPNYLEARHFSAEEHEISRIQTNIDLLLQKLEARDFSGFTAENDDLASRAAAALSSRGTVDHFEWAARMLNRAG